MARADFTDGARAINRRIRMPLLHGAGKLTLSKTTRLR